MVNPADARVTVSLTNIPLIEALRYVTSLATLKFKVEPYAVFVVPASVNTDVLITKEWKVRPDLIPRVPGAGDVNPLSAGPTRQGRGAPAGDQTKGVPGIAEMESAKNWLVSNGVQFNGQASAVYLFIINMIGLGLGPTAVAVCTQYIFRRDDAVNYSLLLVHLVALSSAAILLGGGLKPFCRSLDRLNKWTANA